MTKSFMFGIEHQIGNRIVEAYDGDSYILKCGRCNISDTFTKDHVESGGIVSHHCETVIRRRYPRFYRSWYDMVRRMRDRNCKDYPKYGGKGLGCDYFDLVKFFVKFIESYLEHAEIYGEDDTTIDKDNDLGYIEGHTRWATWEEQALNRRSTNRLIAIDSDGTVFLALGATTFAREHGIDKNVPFDYWNGRGSGQGWKFIRIDNEEYCKFKSFHHSVMSQLYERDMQSLKAIAEYEGISVDSEDIREQIANRALWKQVYQQYASFIL